MISSSEKMVRHAIRAAATLLGVACASAPTPAPERPTERVTATDDLGYAFRDHDPLSYSTVQLDISRDSVFSLLHKVYPEIGVEILLSDPRTGEIGNRQFGKSHDLGGVPLHRYLGCGTSLTGPAADSYRVQMSLISYVTRQGTGTAVKTQLTARANDPGSSKGWVDCLTTGVLEERITRSLADKAGKRMQ